MKQRFIILNDELRPLCGYSAVIRTITFSKKRPPEIFETPNDAQKVIDAIREEEACVNSGYVHRPPVSKFYIIQEILMHE